MLIQEADENLNATVAEVRERYGGLGTIEVEVTRRIGRRAEPTTDPLTISDDAIPEKALKGNTVDMGVG